MDNQKMGIKIIRGNIYQLLSMVEFIYRDLTGRYPVNEIHSPRRTHET